MDELPQSEIARRMPVWYAMSELYTARELEDYTFTWIADELRKSSYAPGLLRYILEEELAPALCGNLFFNPTPVMEGWTVDEVRELVLKYLARKPTLLERIIPKNILIGKRVKVIEPELNRLRAVFGEL